MLDKAVSDNVSDETLAKPEFKFKRAKDGKETNSNCLASDNLLKSTLCNCVNASSDKDPVMLDKPAKLMAATDDELKMSRSPLMVPTELKSKLASIPSPEISIVPSKVGQAFKAWTPEASVTVVEKEHFCEDESAKTSLASTATRKGLINIGSE